MITLKSLPFVTEQEIFDQCTRLLLLQGEKSEAITGMCVYRDAFGNKCAAGHLISDDEYDYCMEGKSWDDLISENRVPVNHHKLIKELQLVHDKTSVTRWPAQLKSVAVEFRLKYMHDDV